jgi:hypothetical protein
MNKSLSEIINELPTKAHCYLEGLETAIFLVRLLKENGHEYILDRITDERYAAEQIIKRNKTDNLNEIFDEKYFSESLQDLQEDIFNHLESTNIPKDTHGLFKGEFRVIIKWSEENEK